MCKSGPAALAVILLATGGAGAQTLYLPDTASSGFYDPAPVFSWSGIYGGVSAIGVTDPGAVGVGLNLGVNVLFDPYLIGVEGEFGFLTDDERIGQVVARFGYRLPEDYLVYGVLGFGSSTATGQFLPIGLGVELPIAETMSVRAQYQYHHDLSGGDDGAHSIRAGLNFHY